MKEFEIYVQNKPGELAKVCEMLGASGVNIRGISSERGHEKSMIKVVTDDETTASAVLARSGIAHSARDVMTIKLADRPGELGKVARKLARAMVNVDSIYIIGKEPGMSEIAITVGDRRKAEDALART